MLGKFQEIIIEFKNLMHKTEDRMKCEEEEMQEGMKSNENGKYMGVSK